MSKTRLKTDNPAIAVIAVIAICTHFLFNF